MFPPLFDIFGNTIFEEKISVLRFLKKNFVKIYDLYVNIFIFLEIYLLIYMLITFTYHIKYISYLNYFYKKIRFPVEKLFLKNS